LTCVWFGGHVGELPALCGGPVQTLELANVWLPGHVGESVAVWVGGYPTEVGNA
jgi:hypothetical protein